MDILWTWPPTMPCGTSIQCLDQDLYSYECRISNTYALESRFDWSGLCIEPNPVYWASLSYRKCQTVAAVVGNSTMDAVLFRFPKRAPPKGGIVGFDNQQDTSSNTMEVQERYTVTLTDILRQFGAPHTMDYLSLDVEGAEHYVMQGFDFDHYRFRLVTIERPNEALCRLLTQQGYVLLKQLKSWGETLWMHHSAAGELDMTALTSIDTEDYQYSESG